MLGFKMRLHPLLAPHKGYNYLRSLFLLLYIRLITAA